MKTPVPGTKKPAAAPKPVTKSASNHSASINKAAGDTTSRRKSPRSRTARASANVRAPQGVAALTSAAMLAAMQPAARTTPRADSSTAETELDSRESFSLGSLLRRAMQSARRCLNSMGAHLPGQALGGRTLQLVEMQSLGEKRFVAVLRVGGQRFLIGGAAGSVQMLGEVGETATTAIPPRPLRREKA